LAIGANASFFAKFVKGCQLAARRKLVDHAAITGAVSDAAGFACSVKIAVQALNDGGLWIAPIGPIENRLLLVSLCVQRSCRAKRKHDHDCVQEEVVIAVHDDFPPMWL
jgi:hypothetical protein